MNSVLEFDVRVSDTRERAVDKVTAALQQEGFSVLTRIDIDKAFPDMTSAQFRPYTILGACNPQLAHAALTCAPELGLILPCNITVEGTDDGSLIRIVNPAVMIEADMLRSEGVLFDVAQDTTERLQRVVEALRMS